VATNKTIQDRFSKVRSERPYLKKFDLWTPPLTSRRNSRRRTKGQRTLIEKVVISTDTKTKKTTTKMTLNFCETTSYWKTSATDHVPRLSRRRQGWTEEGEPIDGEVGVAAALGFLEEAAGSILLVFLFLSDVTFICYKWIERF
jgi:hypothetical protein